MEAVLIAKGVTKSFGEGDTKTEIIHGVDMSFSRGEFTALIGPSGSGKSTLLYMLGALERPDEGSIVINGQDIAELDDVALAHLRNVTLGFVFQFHFLLPEFTARENVAMPLLIQGNIPASEAMTRADALLERVGLSEKIHSRPGQMSGGQMQRVAIARALVNNPKIVFCDEPTGSLDTHSSEQVYQLLRALNHELGQTIIVVTHEMTFAERSDRIINIIDGKVASDVWAQKSE